MEYETVIGLEVHARLLTRSKLFCADANAYGGAPNEHAGPVTLAHPGTLPYLNAGVVSQALRLGLALGCRIAERMFFERKNYFYPDLPKGYQLSQMKTPVCAGGSVEIMDGGVVKNIALNRIHIEEDAGKSLHDQDDRHTLIDLNRAGTPLLEIVTEPVLRSADEAFHFLAELRKTVRWLGICDGNMEEGSLRCDANISIRKRGETKLGTKVEVKNLNSLRYLKRAIEMEAARQAAEVERGHTIEQHTRGFDAARGETFAMRYKEDADDYRYFPEPDLPPVSITAQMLDEARAGLPELPAAVRRRFMEAYQLNPADAAALSEERALATYFERLAALTGDARTSARWMMGPVRSWLNERSAAMDAFPVSAESLADLLALVKQNEVSHSAAATTLFAELTLHPAEAPRAIAQRLNLMQLHDEGRLAEAIARVMDAHPDKVKEYGQGKKGLIGFFMGQLMREAKNLDPQAATRLLTEALNRIKKPGRNE